MGGLERFDRVLPFGDPMMALQVVPLWDLYRREHAVETRPFTRLRVGSLDHARVSASSVVIA